MSEREYIVTLNVGVDYAAFNAEMIEETGAGDIPNRTVEVTNARPISQRNTHYSLTDEEAVELAQDSRVAGVEIPPDQRDDLDIGFDAVQTGDFTKTNSDSGVYLNWGMRRCATTTNDYNTGNTVSGDYAYNLDGSGVDVVIHDSGLHVDHPEFQDADGVSRVQQIDWYTESGVSGTQDANHYRDNHGHGTHVAGTVAGKTYGWAKNARIYSIKVSGLEGTGDSGTGIPISDCFDVIKGWHNNKPIDPATGYKRPTIVNMSWGYGSTNTFEPYDGYYRGTQWTYDNNNSSVATNLATSSQLQNRTGLPLWNSYSSGNARRLNTRITSVDNDVQELIDAGIHVCIASGNRNLTIDVSGGPDYDNRYRVYPVEAGASQPGGYIYYCRGSSPFSNDAFMVGNVDSATNSNDDLEQRASSSNHGPGVDIYAPGTRIMSACSNTNAIGGQDYNVDSNYKQANISGTSMASPQVCGVGALALQVNPHMTPAQLKTFLHNQSQSGKLREDANYTNWTIADSDYSSSSSSRYLAGAPDRFLYSPYPGQYKFRIQNTQELYSMSNLKELTMDHHRSAERCGFVKVLLGGNISNELYGTFLINQYHKYTALENLAMSKGLLDGIESIVRADKILADANEMIEDTNIELLDSTAQYKEHIQTLNDHDLFAHIYVHHMGDLSGGQMIKKRVPGACTMYDFDGDVNEIKNDIRGRCKDSMAPEARMCFDFAIKQFNELSKLTA